MKKSFATRGRGGPFHVEQFCGTLLLARQTEKVSGVMSNARRPSKSENPLTEDVLPQTIDPLEDYRKALSDLQSAAEKRTTLLSIQADLEGQLARMEVDREAALSRASEADDLGAAEADERLRIADRLEVLRRKLVDVGGRLFNAEVELASEQGAVIERLGSLHRAYVAHVFAAERARYAEQFVERAVAPHILDLITAHSKALVPVKALSIISGGSTEALIASATRLLERVSLQEGFNVPAWQPAAPTAPELDPLWTPGPAWGDRGVDVELEIQKILKEDPSITTMPAALRALKRKFPHVFEPPKEGALSLNEPLPMKAPMIGDTKLVEEPVEEQFSHAH